MRLKKYTVESFDNRQYRYRECHMESVITASDDEEAFINACILLKNTRHVIFEIKDSNNRVIYTFYEGMLK